MTQSTSAGNAATISGRLVRELRTLLGRAPLRTQFFLGIARLLPDFTLSGVRTSLHRLAGCACAPQATLLGKVALVGEGDLAPRLSLGRGCLIAPSVTFGLDAAITVGQNVSISPGATLYTATHGIGFGSRRMAAAVSAKPIVVEDGVWVGMQSLILPGVTLGRGCVVSAGSVVTESVEPNMLVGGNPATVQRRLPFGDR